MVPVCVFFFRLRLGYPPLLAGSISFNLPDDAVPPKLNDTQETFVSVRALKFTPASDPFTQLATSKQTSNTVTVEVDILSPLPPAFSTEIFFFRQDG